MKNQIERIDRKLKYEGKIIKVYSDTLRLPDGTDAEYDFISHGGATAVVPVTAEGKILMVRQFRNALDRLTLEIPAGKLDDVSEEPEACARRELEEETGYRAGKLEKLLSLRTWIAFCNELVTVYVATELLPSKQNLDEDEFIDVEAWDVELLKEKIYSGEIEDAKTISAILAYDAKYNRR